MAKYLGVVMQIDNTSTGGIDNTYCLPVPHDHCDCDQRCPHCRRLRWPQQPLGPYEYEPPYTRRYPWAVYI